MNWTSLFLFILGAAAVIYGLLQIWEPLAFVGAGALLLRVAFVADERTTP